MKVRVTVDFSVQVVLTKGMTPASSLADIHTKAKEAASHMVVQGIAEAASKPLFRDWNDPRMQPSIDHVRAHSVTVFEE